MSELSKSQSFLKEILAIESPTNSEQQMVSFFKSWSDKTLPKGLTSLLSSSKDLKTLKVYSTKKIKNSSNEL